MWAENFCVPIDQESQLTLLTVEWQMDWRTHRLLLLVVKNVGHGPLKTIAIAIVCDAGWPCAMAKVISGPHSVRCHLTVLIALNVCKFLMGNCCSVRLARGAKQPAILPVRVSDRQTDATQSEWERERERDLKLREEKSCTLYFSKFYCKTFQIHAADKVTNMEGTKNSCTRLSNQCKTSPMVKWIQWLQRIC